MKQKQRARARSRRLRADPTQARTKAGPEFRYFTAPKAAARARLPKLSTAYSPLESPEGRGVSTGAPSAAYTYYEPPPPPKPLWALADADVLAWLDTQPFAYQETARQLAGSAGVAVAEHERRRSESPCDECGYDGRPSGMHRARCTVGTVRAPRRLPRGTPAPVAEEDDDALPF